MWTAVSCGILGVVLVNSCEERFPLGFREVGIRDFQPNLGFQSLARGAHSSVPSIGPGKTLSFSPVSGQGRPPPPGAASPPGGQGDHYRANGRARGPRRHPSALRNNPPPEPEPSRELLATEEVYLHCKKTPPRKPRTIAQPPGATSSTAPSSSETRKTSNMSTRLCPYRNTPSPPIGGSGS